MDEDQLYLRIAGILDQAHTQVARTINTAMVQAYWLIGREIVLVEQGGAARAGYGDQLIHAVAIRLTARFGRGVGVATLRRARAFYAAFPHGSTIAQIRSTALIESSPTPFSPMLGWSHYLALLRVRRPEARAFYEVEAARERWSVRELERQIGSLLFERSVGRRSLTGDTSPGALAVASPRDVIREPFVLEFLDLGDQPRFHERDLEQAIIDRLGEFLLELGRERAEHEAPTIGIVLCSDKNDAMVQIALPRDRGQLITARYQTYLPSEDELRAELIRGREEIERVRRLGAP